MQRLVIASGNPGKLRELRALLAPLGFDPIAQGTLGIADADEPHATFIENALAKARHASAASGLPALADDSGLCVDALGGAPGVRSARYAVEHDGEANASVTREEQDRANNAKLVAALLGIADRRARYVCVLAMLRSADDPEPLVASGDWPGTIVAAPRGMHGFGYDPYFHLVEHGMTVAELAPDVKNRVSHRAIASRRLVEMLRARSSS